MILKEGTPGARAEHVGLDERPFGLDGVIQIMRGPGVQHLREGDSAKLGMLNGSRTPSAINRVLEPSCESPYGPCASSERHR